MASLQMSRAKPTRKKPTAVKAKVKKHDRISVDLRKRILAGEFTGQVPGQRVLADHYGVNFLTVRRAVATLVKEGLLVREPGRGTFVTRLKRERTHTIAAVFGGLSFGLGGQHAALLQGIQEEAARDHYDLILRPHHGEAQVEKQVIEEILKREKVDGVLLWPTRDQSRSKAISLLKQANLPFVVMVRVDTEFHEEVSYVIDDVYKGGYDATKHLISLGHRKIGYLARTSSEGAGEWFEEERWRGFRQAQIDAKIEPGPRLQADWIINSSRTNKAVPLKFLEELRNITALFCMNDYMALAFLNLQKALGLHIPENMSVVGYDDIEAADLMGLTTMKMPMRDIGVEAMRCLLDEIEHPRTVPIRKVLEARLIERTTTIRQKS